MPVTQIIVKSTAVSDTTKLTTEMKGYVDQLFDFYDDKVMTQASDPVNFNFLIKLLGLVNPPLLNFPDVGLVPNDTTGNFSFSREQLRNGGHNMIIKNFNWLKKDTDQQKLKAAFTDEFSKRNINNLPAASGGLGDIFGGSNSPAANTPTDTQANTVKPATQSVVAAATPYKNYIIVGLLVVGGYLAWKKFSGNNA